MFYFDTDERDQALVELAALGIKNRIGYNDRDAYAMLGHLAQLLRFALFLAPELGTPSMRVALTMYELFKKGEFAAAPQPEQPPRASAADSRNRVYHPLDFMTPEELEQATAAMPPHSQVIQMPVRRPGEFAPGFDYTRADTDPDPVAAPPPAGVDGWAMGRAAVEEPTRG